ncbi:MAG: BPSS1780 family membrane protein [Proteobacteria bacterium]|nr:BPSS1780 family membrane protein [Pseudomonadota bacterium]
MQARLLPAVRGVYWIFDGFRLYRRNPPMLTTLTLGYLLLVVAFGQLQPIGPFLLPLFLPMLTVLIANGCRTLNLGLARAELFFGLRQKRAALLRLGGLHLIGTMAILAIDLLLQGGESSTIVSGKETGEGSFNPLDEAEMLWHMLRLLLFALPVLLAFWFAPLLTAWDGLPVLKSLFFSLVAVWRNWRAFVVYALAASLIGVVLPGLLLLIASLISKPLAEVLSVVLRILLLLVFAPVLMTGIYQSYQDVFAPAANPGTPSDAG